MVLTSARQTCRYIRWHVIGFIVLVLPSLTQHWHLAYHPVLPSFTQSYPVSRCQPLSSECHTVSRGVTLSHNVILCHMVSTASPSVCQCHTVSPSVILYLPVSPSVTQCYPVYHKDHLAKFISTHRRLLLNHHTALRCMTQHIIKRHSI